MENQSRIFWTLVPPRGDTRLQALQSALYRGGVLSIPPVWAFIPWGSLPERVLVRPTLPLKTDDWVLEMGWLGLRTAGLPQAVLQDFPSGIIILGRGDKIPETPPPCLAFSSLRAQKWQWSGNLVVEAPHLEVEILEEFRIGRG